jgi:hypothetical protein
MQANIRLVTVRGEQQGRDADLDHVQQFEVETDAGHRYLVVCQGPLLGAGMPGATTYRFKKAGALFSSGKQMDLWNAVQSLLE